MHQVIFLKLMARYGKCYGTDDKFYETDGKSCETDASHTPCPRSDGSRTVTKPCAPVKNAPNTRFRWDFTSRAEPSDPTQQRKHAKEQNMSK